MARHQVPVGQAELRFDVCQVVHIALAGQFTSCEAGEPELMLNLNYTEGRLIVPRKTQCEIWCRTVPSVLV